MGLNMIYKIGGFVILLISLYSMYVFCRLHVFFLGFSGRRRSLQDHIYLHLDHLPPETLAERCLLSWGRDSRDESLGG